MTLALTPTDLPRLRDDLAAFALSPGAAQLRLQDVEQKRIPAEPAELAQKRAWLALADGELFYISTEMCDLIRSAAPALPEFVLSGDDPPTRSGLAYFATPVEDVDDDGLTVRVVAMAWIRIMNAVRIWTFVERDTLPIEWTGDERRTLFDLAPPIFPLGSWQSRESDGKLLPHREGIDAGRNYFASIKTLWLLMRQPLTEETAERPDRPTRRRLQREGRPVPPIRVIGLRRPPSSGNGAGESGREWHHRWIVRGHWRQAACGAGRTERRPVWIAPHVKGPEDAPLIGGEKVYLVSDRKPAEATP